MLRSHSKAIKIKTILLHLFVIGGVIISMMPFYWMVINSLKARNQVMVVPPRWWFDVPHWENYLKVFSQTNFGTGFLNSSFIAVVSTLGILFFSSLGGYAFAKYKFPGRDALFKFLLATMMIPDVAVLIPAYIFAVRINWVNTYKGMIVPGLASAFGIFTMRQYMYSIPDELLDAARIDGASEFRIFMTIVLPMSVPGLTTLAIFTFFSEWNSFLWPMIMIRSKDMYTLPLSLMLLESRAPQNVDYPVVFAASFLATIPTLLVFFLLQRNFTGQDVAEGSLKL